MEHEQRPEKRNSNFLNTLTQHYRTDYGSKIKTKQSRICKCVCLYEHMMDCHLIQPYHYPSICFTDQRDIFAEKLLARQSCADGWGQHIKGLCGSVVSINGLSRSLLPHKATSLRWSSQQLSAVVRLLKEMEWVPNKDITVTHNIKDGLLQFHVIGTGLCLLYKEKLPSVHVLNFKFFSSTLWIHWISVSDPLYASS